MILELNPSNIGIIITVLGTIIAFIVQHNKHQFKIDSLEEKISFSEKKIEKSENHNIDMATRNSVLETKMNMIEITINEIRNDIKMILKNQGR
jgi:hypothetical protein